MGQCLHILVVRITKFIQMRGNLEESMHEQMWGTCSGGSRAGVNGLNRVWRLRE